MQGIVAVFVIVVQEERRQCLDKIQRLYVQVSGAHANRCDLKRRRNKVRDESLDHIYQGT